MDKFYVYILRSIKSNKFYVGYTSNSLQQRLDEHNLDEFPGSYTTKHKPWELSYFLECSSITQSIKIEKHIKSMKSSLYIKTLLASPEIGEKLLLRFS